jgi:hypothetical protein
VLPPYDDHSAADEPPDKGRVAEVFVTGVADDKDDGNTVRPEVNDTGVVSVVLRAVGNEL